MFSTSLIKKKSYLCAQFTRTRNYSKGHESHTSEEPLTTPYAREQSEDHECGRWFST